MQSRRWCVHTQTGSQKLLLYIYDHFECLVFWDFVPHAITFSNVFAKVLLAVQPPKGVHNSRVLNYIV